jgi:cytoskeletal protein RodZ
MVGEVLKERREELGQDLREIANDLKIRYDYLKAIEDGDLGKIPAEVYVKGYIREYAKILRLDPEILIDAYMQQKLPPQPEKNKIAEQEGVQGKGFRLRYAVIASLLIMSAAIIIASVQFPVHQKKSTLSVPAPETKVETTKESIPTKPANPKLVLEVFATDTTWLLVRIDKTDPKEVLMKPGESVTWHAKEGFSLKIGNAGGVRLVFSGKEVGKLGEKGQVIKINLPEAKI